MSLIRTDVSVTPSFSRAGKTAAALSGSLQALNQLKGQIKHARKRELAEASSKAPLNERTKEHLYRVLDQPKLNMGTSYWNADDNRWKLDHDDDMGNIVKLPMTIDWDLLEDGPDKDTTKGTMDIAKLLEASSMDGKHDNKGLRASAVFKAPPRLDILSDRSTVVAPEPGRYDPKLSAVKRRSPAARIVDRSLFRTKEIHDERDFIEPKFSDHTPSVSIGTLTGRGVVAGRIMCTVTMAQQKSVFNSGINHGMKDVVYDVDGFWERGPGKKTVPVHAMGLAVGRKEKKVDPYDTAPHVYPSVNSHTSWTGRSPLFKTTADLGNTVNLSRMLGRTEKKRAWEEAEKERLDYREERGLPEEHTIANCDLVRGQMEMDKMVSRDRTAEAVRQAQTASVSPHRFSVSDDNMAVNRMKTVPFSKLLPRPPIETRATAPDTVYNVARALDKAKKPKIPTANFEKMTARTSTISPGPPSMYMSYPNANKPGMHTRSIDIGKTLGHRNIETVSDWQRAQDVPGRAPLSSTGASIEGGGFAWHPSDSPLRLAHVASPDLGGGGKARPSIARKMVDIRYDAERGLSHIDRRTPTVIIGSGPAGQGRHADEMKAERVRLEEEIRVIIQSRPPSNIMPPH